MFALNETVFSKGKGKAFKGTDELFCKLQQNIWHFSLIDLLFIYVAMYYFNILFSIKMLFYFWKSPFCCHMKNLEINQIFMLEGNILEE